jgi:hypothetical protein
MIAILPFWSAKEKTETKKNPIELLRYVGIDGVERTDTSHDRDLICLIRTRGFSLRQKLQSILW